jgi:hypothetical protein
LGAVAGAIVSDNVKAYALKKGLYVIEQTGETIKIETLGNTFTPAKF